MRTGKFSQLFEMATATHDPMVDLLGGGNSEAPSKPQSTARWLEDISQSMICTTQVMVHLAKETGRSFLHA